MSKPYPDDTIAAIATPAGRGGVGIVRVSGTLVRQIAQSILAREPRPRMAEYLPFYDLDGQVLDQGIALLFQGPNSFTGEDVLELQGHGGPVILDLLLQRVLALGARMAEPGEFSLRAYLNDKIDLVQAEAIADLIESSTEQAARSAMHSLQGVFSRQILQLVEAVIHLRIYVEAALDFPEEEIDFLADERVARQLQDITTQLAQIRQAAKQGSLLRDGIQVVIAGQPNAGKSSLLNALAGQESAIVTDIAGTTRDVLREQIQIDGLPLHIIDTAGLRISEDVVEQEGIRRAWAAIAEADVIMLVMDDQQGLQYADQQILEQMPVGPALLHIYNKCDQSGREPGLIEQGSIAVSAKTGIGMDELKQELKSVCGFHNLGEGGFIARRRHLEALQQAANALERARQQLQAGELLAEELLSVQNALAEITGEFSADELLGRIFSSFCIGK